MRDGNEQTYCSGYLQCARRKPECFRKGDCVTILLSVLTVLGLLTVLTTFTVLVVLTVLGESHNVIAHQLFPRSDFANLFGQLLQFWIWTLLSRFRRGNQCINCRCQQAPI